VQSGRAGPHPDVYKIGSGVLGFSFYAPPDSLAKPRATTAVAPERACNAPNFAVEFFLFFTRQNSGVTFPFSFSLR
jgi:hypothetical protein